MIVYHNNSNSDNLAVKNVRIIELIGFEGSL